MPSAPRKLRKERKQVCPLGEPCNVLCLLCWRPALPAREGRELGLCMEEALMDDLPFCLLLV